MVVLAKHLQLDQQVALKFLLPSALEQAEVEARFAQEARAAAKIRSEHVVRVLDVSALDSGEPYIVMEYLEGTDLAKQLARRGPMSVPQAVASVLQACEALAEAHAAGIVHRDLKLSNLFVASYPDGQPCIKVLDFGISKYSLPGSDPDLSMTGTAAVMGSRAAPSMASHAMPGRTAAAAAACASLRTAYRARKSASGGTSSPFTQSVRVVSEQ